MLCHTNTTGITVLLTLGLSKYPWKKHLALLQYCIGKSGYPFKKLNRKRNDNFCRSFIDERSWNINHYVFPIILMLLNSLKFENYIVNLLFIIFNYLQSTVHEICPYPINLYVTKLDSRCSGRISYPVFTSKLFWPFFLSLIRNR